MTEGRCTAAKKNLYIKTFENAHRNVWVKFN